MHIAVAGNIGSGKTTLTTMLAKHYGWTPKFEAVAHNPYLEDYYNDIHRWAFALEVYFLKERFRDILEIAHSEGTVIQDRSIFEGVYVFTANNQAMGNMSDTDYQTYMELFESMMQVVRYPDLMIYLKYEKSIQIEYLTNLNQRYEEFIFQKYKGEVMVVDVDEIDFLNNPRHFAAIIDRIDARLFGLFSGNV